MAGPKARDAIDLASGENRTKLSQTYFLAPPLGTFLDVNFDAKTLHRHYYNRQIRAPPFVTIDCKVETVRKPVGGS